MKHIIPFLTLSAILLLAGCGSLVKKTTTFFPYTNSVPVISTNTATGIISTNTITVTGIRTNITFAVNPSVSSAIETGQQISQFVPPPYGTLLTGLLGLSTAALGAYAGYKNKQVNSTADALQTAQDTITAVAAGVEAAGNAYVKSSIQSHAAAAGVQNYLDPIVQAVSATMPPQGPSVTVPATPKPV